jgi:hypothetical protein
MINVLFYCKEVILSDCQKGQHGILTDAKPMPLSPRLEREYPEGVWLANCTGCHSTKKIRPFNEQREWPQLKRTPK